MPSLGELVELWLVFLEYEVVVRTEVDRLLLVICAEVVVCSRR